jgi:hypothetical protein
MYAFGGAVAASEEGRQLRLYLCGLDDLETGTDGNIYVSESLVVSMDRLLI